MNTSAPGPPLFEDAAAFCDVLRWRASRHPDAAFLTCLADDERVEAELSFGALHRRATAIAARLSAQARVGDRALLLFPPGADFVAAFFGCLYAGVVAIPAYPPRNARHMPRIEAILADADARLLLTVSSARERITEWLHDHREGRATGDRSVRLQPDQIVCTDAVEAREAWTPPALGPGDVAFLQYTSGSTGDPKGVVVTHGNLLANERMIRQTFGYDESSHFVSWLPIYHDMGLVGNLLQPLFLGTRAILMSPAAFLQKPIRWLRAISTYRARTTGAPNFAFDLAARTITAEQKAALDLSCLDLVYNGSEPIDARALDRFAEAFAACGLRRGALYPCYGMAETTLLATGSRQGSGPRYLAVDADDLSRHRVTAAASDDERARTLVGCGRSVDGQEIVIVDPERGVPVSGDAVGEVWLRGPHVAAGYWNRPELTCEVFEARLAGGEGPFLRTGDLGFLRGDELFITGRLKDVVIVRGRNYYPQDIERAASAAHAAFAVGSAAAFGVEVSGDERLVVVQEVQRSALRDLDAEAATAALARAVAEEFDLQLHEAVLVKPLNVPKTSSGKIQRRAARERYLSGDCDIVARSSTRVRLKPDTTYEGGSPTPRSPERESYVVSGFSRTSVASWLRDAIARHLQRRPDQIDPREPFSAYGLDSMTLVRLSGELSEWLQRELPTTLLYDYPSIDALAAHLTGAGSLRESRVESHDSRTREPIAIVGIGCRLPGGARDADTFWRLLDEGVDAIGEVPAGRWDAAAASGASRHGGFLPDIDRFDPGFFGISPREADAMDPQQRLLLEVAWEALEHAGIAADCLTGTRTGVFVGISTHDYAGLQRQAAAEAATMYSGVGNAFSAASGRLSYLLGLHGPSLAVDTACSSSLVAVHLACQSLRSGECAAALAGGVNAVLTPDLTIAFTRAGMMAPDGRCKAFDASADGYVRSEGCGVVVLKRLSDAVAAGDRVLAVIRGTAVNQDGRSNGLTAPSGPAQEAVIREALADAQLPAAAVDYVEAHGTGTSLGDPIEVRALAAALGDGRQRPLLVGSVKTNVGHLEAAAGVASLIKVVLALQHGRIPPSLHFRTPNPHVPWASLPLQVVGESRAWPGQGTRTAGVSSFGFTGTNAHVVVELPPEGGSHSEGPVASGFSRKAQLLTLSARDEKALDELVRRYDDLLATTGEALADIAHTANTGRARFDVRVAAVGSTPEEMRAALGRTRTTPVDPVRRPRVAMLFTGQGSQYAGMGRQLYDAQSAFREALDRCDAIVRGLRGEALLPIVFDSASGDAVHATQWTQPALFALEYALAELWRSWGVVPDVVVGHSVGELAAATVAGVFTLEDGVRLAAERGRLMAGLPAGGGMLVVHAREDVAVRAAGGETSVGVAGTNAPDETVLSGSLEALARIAARLEAAGVRTTPLRVSHAFHSPLMIPVADAFARIVAQCRLTPPTIPIVSNLSGRVAGDELASVDYWRAHVTAPVRFLEGVAALHAFAVTHAIEAGPAPVLSALAARGWLGDPVEWLPSLRRGRDEPRQMLQGLAALYIAGADVDLAGIDRGIARRRVTLPSYPFARERCWIAETTPAADSHTVTTATGQLVWEPDALERGGPLWHDYRIDGVSTPSPAVYPQMALAAAHDALQHDDLQVSRVEFFATQEIAAAAVTRVQVVVTPAGREAADCVVSVRDADGRWTRVAEARVARPAPATVRRPLDFGVMFFNGSEAPDGRRHYDLVLEGARFADRHGFASVWVPERHYTAFGGLYPNPALLHAALARETRHVRLMAGSMVASLHHPLRAAEDWALVDNLSDGRVGVSLAAGWNPDDFATAPGAYADRHEQVFRHLETLRRLWRGEPVPATSGTGRDIDVRIYPTPVQPEFPAWITAAGNPLTFERAGACGAHLLTHMLDQDAQQLAAKIALYRSAREGAGHDPATGRVTVMLHTFLGDDIEVVREQVRAPYCEYLKANIGLLKGLAFSRGADLDLAALSPRDLDEFVSFVYDRFFETRALLGTPESAARLAERLHEAGVDEVACLIDFGPPARDVVAHLPHIARLRGLVRERTTAAARSGAPRITGLAAVRARCTQEIDGPTFYRRLAARGVAFGPALQPVEHFARRDGEALATIAAGTDRALLLEAALQAFTAALPASSFVNTSDGIYVPWDASDITLPSGAVLYAHAAVDDAFTGRVAWLDRDGREVGGIGRLVARRVQPARPARVTHDDAARDWFYEVRWETKAIDGPARAAGHWLIVADTSGVAAGVAAALRTAGNTVTTISAGAIDLADATAVRHLVVNAEAQQPLAGVVTLATLDAGNADETDLPRIEQGERLGVAGTLHVAQALAAAGSGARLWAVTRQAQSVGGEDGAPAVAQAGVWGLGRVIAVDHPELWGGLIDLPATSAPDAAARTVVGELSHGEDPEVAWRGEARLVPRLVRREAPPLAAPTFSPDAIYLITGGTGGLGRRVAHWMVRRGATHLVLTGLHALPSDGERYAAIQSLEAQGAQVTVLQADASDDGDMARVFAAIAASGRPLRGIVHLAGRPENQPLADVRFARDRAILAPKVAGTWIVHERTRHLPLEFFVTFSSISAVWGSRGQPLYAAANHFLDAMTAYRRAHGLPITTVNWGPWSEGGMVDREGLDLLAKMGIASLTPDAATAVLGRLLAAGTARAVVADVDWRTFKDLFEARGPRPLLALVEARDRRNAAAATELRRGLEALDAPERLQRLVDHVRGEAALVLGWRPGERPDLKKGFFEMGMDSLTALELKNRLQAALGVTLTATVVFNYSTIEALAGYLASQIAGSAPEAVAAAGDPALDDLSEDELARLLDEQIGAIDSASEA